MVFDRKEYMKEYHEKNKEKLNNHRKEYNKNNKEKINQYRKTEKAIKGNRIASWKHRGLIHDNYDKLYADYINTLSCNVCNHDFSKYKKCMDHDHDTGLFRNFLCLKCNVYDNWKKI